MGLADSATSLCLNFFPVASLPLLANGSGRVAACGSDLFRDHDDTVALRTASRTCVLRVVFCWHRGASSCAYGSTARPKFYVTVKTRRLLLSFDETSKSKQAREIRKALLSRSVSGAGFRPQAFHKSFPKLAVQEAGMVGYITLLGLTF